MTVQVAATDITEGWMKVAGWCAYISGVAAIIGLVFLGLFFGGAGDYFGPLNDIFVIIQYALLMPIAVTIWLLLRPQGNPINTVVMIAGLAGMLSVVVLQALLVAGVLPFSQQIKMAMPGFLVVIGWFMAIWQLARPLNILPKSPVVHALAGLYVGYPLWAFKVGARFLGG